MARARRDGSPLRNGVLTAGAVGVATTAVAAETRQPRRPDPSDPRDSGESPDEDPYADDPLGLGPSPFAAPRSAPSAASADLETARSDDLDDLDDPGHSEPTPTVKRPILRPEDIPEDTPGESMPDQTPEPTQKRPALAAPLPEDAREREPAKPSPPPYRSDVDLYGSAHPSAPEPAPHEPDESDESEEPERPEPSTKTAILGFYFGVVCMLFAPVLYFSATRWLFPDATAGDLAPFALLQLAVPAILVAVPRTRRFGLYMVLGLIVTGIVVSVSAVAALFVLIKSDL